MSADLQALSRRYGIALDQRDREALLSIFCPDAIMQVEQPGRDTGLLRGHAELGRLTDIIARWPRTIHVVGRSRYELGENHASGEVHCTAHHFDSIEPTANDLVMRIRYLDRYQLAAGGRWRIAHRTVTVDATEDLRGGFPTAYPID